MVCIVAPVPTLIVLVLPSMVIEEEPTVRTPTIVASPATLRLSPTNTLLCEVTTPTNVDTPDTLRLSNSV